MIIFELFLEKGLTFGKRSVIIMPVPSNTWGYSSAGRALEWHSRGQRFDPAYLHQERPETARFQVFSHIRHNGKGEQHICCSPFDFRLLFQVVGEFFCYIQQIIVQIRHRFFHQIVGDTIISLSNGTGYSA